MSNDYEQYTPDLDVESAPAAVPFRGFDSPAAPVEIAGGTDEPERGRKRSNERSNVRRIASKYDEILGASAEHLELLSTALGVPNTTIELTVAIITGNRSGLSALNDTLALSQPGEPFDLIVSAISLGRQRIKGVWSVLAEMGALNGPVPAGDVKAGGAIAKAAGSLSQENIDEITAVLTLAKK